MKEINYFYPGRRSSVGDEVLCYDCLTIALEEILFELVGSHTEAKEKQEEIEESVGEAEVIAAFQGFELVSKIQEMLQCHKVDQLEEGGKPKKLVDLVLQIEYVDLKNILPGYLQKNSSSREVNGDGLKLINDMYKLKRVFLIARFMSYATSRIKENHHNKERIITKAINEIFEVAD
ncbi:hypothetical protein ACJX0J_005320 [Zea mays]